MARKPVIAIDLDGTLLYYDGWKGVDHFGPPLPGAIELTRRLAAWADIVIHSCRTNPELGRPECASLLANRVKRWLDRHGFVYHDVWIGEGKPIADAYLDDKAVPVFCNVGFEGPHMDSAIWRIRGLCGLTQNAGNGPAVASDATVEPTAQP